MFQKTMKLKALKRLLLISLVLFQFTFIRCTSDKGKPEIICTTPDSVFYNLQVAPIIQSSCLFSGCHEAGSSNGDLSSYANVLLKVNDGTFENRVLNLQDMPPAYSPGPIKLNKCEKEIIKRWLQQGAKP